MKILFPSVAIVGGAVLGLAIGLTLRHSPEKSGGHKTEDNSLARPGSNRGQPQRAGAAVDDSPLTTQLARDLRTSTNVTRWLYWWNAIEKATPADFPRLARLAQGNRIATRLVAERWAELAPRHFFDTLRAAEKSGNKYSGEFADVLFTSWTKQDKNAAIAALDTPEVFPKRMDWQRQVANALMDFDPETGLRTMSQWHIENYGPAMGAVRSWAAADPRHAAEFTMANPAGYASTEALQVIGEVWGKANPGQAMDFAAAQRGALARTLSETVLKSWAERDLNGAANWLASSDSSTLIKFSPAFVEAWAKQDAPSALAWSEANLTGSTQLDAVRGVFTGAAQKDVASAAALVSSMQPSTARSQAAVAVADKWFPDAFASKAVSPETLNWLANLDGNSIRQVVEKVGWKWTDTDPNSLASLLQSATNIIFPVYTYNNLARSMGRSDPVAAMNWAGTLPEQLSLAAGSSIFSEWGRGQFDSAMQWFNQMPATDSRREPYLTSLLQQLAWDPQADSRFGQIAALAPSTARSALQNMGLPEERKSALLALVSPQTRQ